MGKKHPYYGKCMSTNFPGSLPPPSPYTMGFVGFFCAMRNWRGNPCISHMMKYTTVQCKSMGKNAQTLEIVWETISQAFPIRWVLLPFPVLWEINGETHAFPIC